MASREAIASGRWVWINCVSQKTVTKVPAAMLATAAGGGGPLPEEGREDDRRQSGGVDRVGVESLFQHGVVPRDWQSDQQPSRTTMRCG